jgi:hypothetical protein
LQPICIKLSRVVHQRCLSLSTIVPGKPPVFQQWLTGFSLPFLLAQPHRQVTLEVPAPCLSRAVLDGMREAVLTLQPQEECMETQCSP